MSVIGNGFTKFLVNKLSTKAVVFSGGMLGNEFFESKETNWEFQRISSDLILSRTEYFGSNFQYFLIILIKNFEIFVAGDGMYDTTWPILEPTLCNLMSEYNGSDYGFISFNLNFGALRKIFLMTICMIFLGHLWWISYQHVVITNKLI